MLQMSPTESTDIDCVLNDVRALRNASASEANGNPSNLFSFITGRRLHRNHAFKAETKREEKQQEQRRRSSATSRPPLSV